MNITHTIIAVQDGITRTYGCDNYFNAVVCADILAGSGHFQTVQIWQGSQLRWEWKAPVIQQPPHGLYGQPY